MIEYIQIFYSLVSKLFYVLFFSFLYIPLFNKCNVKKKVKKNNKVKIISQPKSVLAIIYLILLFILFKCFTFKMILFIVISIIICSLMLVDRMSPVLNESLHEFNKSYLMILCWKLLHTIFTVVNMITNPLFSIINNKINVQLGTAKNFITKVANLNLSDDSDSNFEKEILKISEEMSNMSDYICKSKNKTEKKEKVIELNDIKEKSISNTKEESISNIKGESISDTKEESVSDINTSECASSVCDISSKSVMIKKMTEINKAIDETNTDSIEDMTITEISN